MDRLSVFRHQRLRAVGDDDGESVNVVDAPPTSPEEIRKANLRGAIIDNSDFYLVDLRDALYDSHQERHFRRYGAILEMMGKSLWHECRCALALGVIGANVVMLRLDLL